MGRGIPTHPPTDLGTEFRLVSTAPNSSQIWGQVVPGTTPEPPQIDPPGPRFDPSGPRFQPPRTRFQPPWTLPDPDFDLPGPSRTQM